VDVLDELADLQRTLVVAQSHGVDGQTRELFDERDQGLQVLFDRDVEGITVLEVDGNYGVLELVL